jgi:hypothetical protein
MKPWATAQLVSSLTGTDSAQVPATKLTGEASLRASKGATATVVVPTDGGAVAIELMGTPGRGKRVGGRWESPTTFTRRGRIRRKDRQLRLWGRRVKRRRKLHRVGTVEDPIRPRPLSGVGAPLGGVVVCWA